MVKIIASRFGVFLACAALACGLFAGVPAPAFAGASGAGYYWPLRVSAGVNQGFGSGHSGIDIPIGYGTPVIASRAGTVGYVQYWNGYSKTNMQSYGNLVIIYHGDNSTSTYYAHLSSISVRKGQNVAAGQQIGAVGSTGNSTGNHLHFELHTGARYGSYGASDGRRVNPLSYVSNANLYSSAPAHQHNYNQRANVSYPQYNDFQHQVNYTARCSCGATAGTKTGYENCTFAWSGLTYKCTKCGKEFVVHDNGVEYVTAVETAIYKGDNPNTGTVGKIPAGTVIKPDVQGKTSSWGKWIGRVTYKGVTGYIHMSDCRFNGNAGKHNFRNGACTECGIRQGATKPGAYVARAKTTAHRSVPDSSDIKQLNEGDEVFVTRVEVTTWNAYWGRTSDGYVVDMANFKSKSSWHNGEAAVIPDGTYSIRVASDTGLALDDPACAGKSGDKLQLWLDNGTAAQKFRLTRNADDGTYFITHALSGKVADVSGASLGDQARIVLWDRHGADNQRWYIEKCGDGAYSLRNKNSNLYLDVGGGSISSGAYMNQWRGNGTAAQKFVFMPEKGSALLEGSTVRATGVSSSYRLEGGAVTPEPVVERLVYAMGKIKVPANGQAADNTHTYAATAKLERGKTYHVQIDAAKRVVGTSGPSGMLAFDFAGNRNACGVVQIPKGTARQTFTIAPDADSTLVFYAGIPGQCIGNAVQLDGVKVYEVLEKGSDYRLSYAGNRSAGTGQVTVTLAGDYTGSLSKTFKVVKASAPAGNADGNPAATVPATKIRSLKAGRGSFTVKWNKKSGAASYQVRYTPVSYYRDVKWGIADLRSAHSSSSWLKVGFLPRKEKYYVQVRVAKTVGGETVYSSWSAKKAVKTK